MPSYTDLEEGTVTVTASAGLASLFTTFNSDTFTIAEGASYVGSYTLTVVLEDEAGNQVSSHITLKIVADASLAGESVSADDAYDLESSNSTSNSTNSTMSTKAATKALMAALGNDTVISQETAQAYSKLSGTASVGGFNWAEAFAKAMKSAPKVSAKTVITNPKPSIESISKSGELLIIFD